MARYGFLLFCSSLLLNRVVNCLDALGKKSVCGGGGGGGGGDLVVLLPVF